MTEGLGAHETTIAMAEAALGEFDAGTDMELRVTVCCSSECSLQGLQVIIVDDQGAAVNEVELAESDGAANETGDFAVKAPIDPGEYTWRAVFPAQEREGVLHEESLEEFSFIVKPHATILEVWDVPSSIVLGGKFEVKLGAKCSAGCDLTGREIEIYDHEGARAATATLGEVSGSDELCCAQVVLVAPGTERRYRWTAKYPEPGLELPHEEASCTFAFGVVRQPEHVLTIEVVENETANPASDANVLLRPHIYGGSAYSSRTDEAGLVRLSVPKGKYQLYVSTEEREKYVPSVNVDSDLAIKVELSDLRGTWREGLVFSSMGLQPPGK